MSSQVTSKVVVQVAILPQLSVTVTVIVCSPAPTCVPAIGICEQRSFTPGVQSSVAVLATRAQTSGMVAWQRVPASTGSSEGQVSRGAVVSRTVIVCLQDLLLLQSSFAVQVRTMVRMTLFSQLPGVTSSE